MNSQSLQQPLKPFFTFITLFGLPFFYAPLIVYLLRVTPSLAIRLTIAIVAIEAICAIIKLVYPKERPVPLPRKTLFQKYESGGFPSIHTARIVAVSIVVSRAYENQAVIFAFALLALCVAYSRIYLKKHDLIDVAGGFVIGTLISLLALAR